MNNNKSTNNLFLFGANDGSNDIQMRQQPLVSLRLFVAVNEGTGFGDSNHTAFQDNTRYGARRTASNAEDSLINGSVSASSSIVASGIPTTDIEIGAFGGNLFFDGTISYFLIGGGFNLTNLDSMLDVVETQFSL